jgi:hypothetical protein
MRNQLLATAATAAIAIAASILIQPMVEAAEWSSLMPASRCVLRATRELTGALG